MLKFNALLIKQMLERIVGERFREHMETLRELTPSHDRGDAANTVGRKETAAVLVEQERLKVVQAGVALRRMEDGTFGTCLACDEEIAGNRLMIVPWSPFCVICQEKLERNELPEFVHFSALTPKTIRSAA